MPYEGAESKTTMNDPGGMRGTPDRRGGGTGNASGTDFHAMAMVAAAVHMMRGTKVGWLEKIVGDIPIAVRAESGGPGDDIFLELESGSTVEVQCKKHLQRGVELWDALEALVDGVDKGTIDYGLLAVAPDSSGTIKNDLATDLIKIGQGVEDSLSDIGADWLKRLKASGRTPSHCANVRIQTLDLLESNGGDRRSVIETLRVICAAPERAEDALNLMFRDAVALMRMRGRWTLPSLVRLLHSQGIKLRHDCGAASIVAKLTTWTETTRGSFYLPAALKSLPIQAMLPTKLVATARSGSQAVDASAALERYHSRTGAALDNNVFDGQWTGRYRRMNVVVAGPGIGKSTLADRLAWEFARDGVPVLVAPVKRIAAAMDMGIPFEAALEQHGLDGSSIDPTQFRHLQFVKHVVVADGLDEAGLLHDQVAEGLLAYTAGHPEATIIVTTRPIGYETARLAAWRHYRLEPPIEKEGHENLGRLLAASRDLALTDAGCLEDAKRELAATPARKAIVASPLLLGMSATLIIRNERLPTTKTELYEELIALFDRRDNDPAAAELSSLQTARILDIVGWELTGNPKLTWQQLEAAGCQRLATDLRQPALAVAPLFSKGFTHWERAGIVEKVHHAGTQLVTFVHKTFGEFAAARFLCQMGDGQKREMERLVDIAAFSEVISFAGALGLGNLLAELFVDRKSRGAEGQFERALWLATDPDARVDDAKAAELAGIALDFVATSAADRFSIGKALCELAKARPAIVGPLAGARLDDPDEEVKLVAWAAAVEAGDAYHDRSRLDQVLETGVKQIFDDEVPMSVGIRANPQGNRVDLVQSIALAMLRAKPIGEMVEFVTTKLSDRPFSSIGFFASTLTVLNANGLELPTSPLDFVRKAKKSVFAESTLAKPSNDWSRCSNRMMRALAAAVAEPPISGPDQSVKNDYPEFSALYALTEIGSTEASDVLKWKEEFDAAAVTEAIRGLVAVSRIDASRLAVEASEIVMRLDSAPNRHAFFLELGNPDIPAPEWQNAAALKLNRERLEGALTHGSLWLTAIAANLLAAMPATEADCVRLLKKASGAAMHYAQQIVASKVDKLVWRDLLLDRLRAGLDRGSEYILTALARGEVALACDVGEIVAAAIRTEDDKVVEGGAALGVRWLAAGGSIDTEAAKSAYRNSRRREGGANGTWLVTKARPELLNLLVAAGALDDVLLAEAISDRNSEAQEIAKREATTRGLATG